MHVRRGLASKRQPRMHVNLDWDGGGGGRDEGGSMKIGTFSKEDTCLTRTLLFGPISVRLSQV